MPATNLLFLLLEAAAVAHTQPNCTTSTCVGIAISYPFCLSSDPPYCGVPVAPFAVHCLTNHLFLTSASGTRYAVRAITYGNYSVRLSDPGLDPRNYSCCPTITSNDDGLFSDQLSPHPDTYAMYISYITCRTCVCNSAYVDDPACGNATCGGVYSYIGRNISPSELEPACSINEEVKASSTSPFREGSYSYSAIHDLVSYGFELSWYQIECGDCQRSNGRCSLGKNRVRCRHYCYEDTPFAERSFWCKLEFYIPFILLIIVQAIGGVLLLRFIVVMSFVIAMVVFRRRVRRGFHRNPWLEGCGVEGLLVHSKR